MTDSMWHDDGYVYAIFFTETDSDPAEWMCDHSGRVFLFTKEGAERVKRQLDVDPRRPLLVEEYGGEQETTIYTGDLLETEW